jgi:hypothetical protein
MGLYGGSTGLLHHLPGCQKVLYSPYINDRATDKFEIVGKSGDYYWVQKNKKKNQVELPAMPWTQRSRNRFLKSMIRI